MRISKIFVIILGVFLSLPVLGAEDGAKLLSGMDLYLSADSVTTSKTGGGDNLAYFEGNFLLKIGNVEYKSDNGLAVITPEVSEYLGEPHTTYRVKVYLEYNIEGPGRAHIPNIVLLAKSGYQGSGLLLKFDVTGQIYITAEEKKAANVSEMPIFDKAMEISETMTAQNMLTVIQPDAEIPKIRRIISPEKIALKDTKQTQRRLETLPRSTKEDPKIQPETDIERPEMRYPVNIASAGSEKIIFDSQKLVTDDGLTAVVVTGRFYLWQQVEQGVGLLEMSADSAVVYYAGDEVKIGAQQTGDDNLQASGPIHSIYLAGNVVMTEGNRTLTASELYYDFNVQQGLAVDSSIKTFDSSRGIPVYIRADRMRQVARNQFTAEDVTITASEFANPQLKLTASSINLTDTTSVDETGAELEDSSYLLEMNDMRMKYHDATLFYWPKVTTDLERPDTPIRSLNISDDSDFGFSVESRWYLHRLLGWQEPENMDSTLAFDVYGERGIGSGIDIEYEEKQYFGRILGYIISDDGADDLGRTRQNIEPEDELRGRFRWQHRQYLEDDWQLTFESSYSSDRNFIEAFYRNEFNTGKEQETIVHLKQTRDNRSLSILGKMRVNDFVDKLEEMPTVEYHLTGESLFDDRFTFFSDTQISRFRQRYDEDSAAATDPTLSEDFFTFAFTRAELDMPFNYRRTRMVPYIAGTYGYEDLGGFDTGLSGMSMAGEKDVFIGEAGLRVSKQFWAVNKDIKSSFWNINQIRHIVRPHAEFAFFSESDDQVEQRDKINLGLVQRWQTKRLVEDQLSSVDWMRLAIDATFVTDDADSLTSPDEFVWNKPYQPLLFRRDMDSYGVRRDMINADYLWQVSDTTSILSDLNYDMDDGTVGQFDIGLSRYRFPDLSYYIGSRYLRNVEIQDEKGSHALLYALTYNINPRYTVLFSQEYNFDYGSAIESELTFIRKYNKMNWAITINSDSTLDRSGIMLSIWPEGIRELAVGSRKYFGLTGSTSNY